MDVISHKDERNFEEEAQYQLKNRPNISIVFRLTLGFIACFTISIGIAAFSMLTMNDVINNFNFIDTINKFLFENYHARFYENNFFAYNTNIEQVITHNNKAQQILFNDKHNIIPVVGQQQYDKIVSLNNDYLLLIKQLSINGSNQDPASLKQEIQNQAEEMMAYAHNLNISKRDSIYSKLVATQGAPFLFLLFLAIFLILLAVFITRQMLWSLQRMVAAARRIADGDFTPIFPKRKYYDELSELAVALNYMMQELAKRHEMLLNCHKMRAIGTLTAGIAHELNNPLNNIVLTASVFSEEYDELGESDKKEMLDDLVSESGRAQLIVRNLLDYTRETELESKSISIQNILDNTIRLVNNQIRMNKVKVKQKIDSCLPNIHGDHKQLTQVFINIVLNALDAMPDGGQLDIVVDVTPNRDWVRVKFTDNGIGIPNSNLDSVFQPFVTTKEDGKGTGLGLSVSHSIIEKHGGDISLESRIQQGSTFTVTLPTAMIPANLTEISDEEYVK